MGLFAPTPQVSSHEWEEVRRRLLARGLSSQDVDAVEAVAKRFGRGIHRREVKEIAAQLRRRRGTHDLTEEQIERVEEALEDKL